MSPPTIPMMIPTVAEVNANDAISGLVSENASPIAAAVPYPPAQPAKMITPSESGASNNGCNTNNTTAMPTATCKEYINTPCAAKPPTLRLSLRTSKSSIITTAAKTTAINTDEYVES